ncbi:MAG: cytochrome b5 domain-containing protein [Actinomycetaceae bacterium]|nr:cytochrome b5 domain-containing protein [Actinomycetaceae bacterium]
MRTALTIGGIILAILLVLAICWVLFMPSHAGDRSKLNREFTQAEQHLIDTRHISAQELSAATCDNGANCWVAINGVVYDMSGIPSWARGLHHGIKAGHDVTEDFVKSGHSVRHLQKLPVVGSLSGEDTPQSQ